LKWKKCCQPSENYDFYNRACSPGQSPKYETYNVSQTLDADSNKTNVTLKLVDTGYGISHQCENENGSVIRNSSKYDLTLLTNGSLLIYDMVKETAQYLEDYCVDFDPTTKQISAVLCNKIQTCSKESKENAITNDCIGLKEPVRGHFKNGFYHRSNDSEELSYEDYCFTENLSHITLCNLVTKCCPRGMKFVKDQVGNQVTYNCAPLGENQTEFQDYKIYFDGYQRIPYFWPINGSEIYSFRQNISNNSFFIQEDDYRRGLCHEMLEENGTFRTIVFTSKPPYDFTRISQIFNGISIVLLIVTAILYFVRPAVSDEHGKCLAIHCLCLAVAASLNLYLSINYVLNPFYQKALIAMKYFNMAAVNWLTFMWIYIAYQIFHSYQKYEVAEKMDWRVLVGAGVGIFVVSLASIAGFWPMEYARGEFCKMILN
jgi:hypothetical protein